MSMVRWRKDTGNICTAIAQHFSMSKAAFDRSVQSDVHVCGFMHSIMIDCKSVRSIHMLYVAALHSGSKAGFLDKAATTQ